MEQQESKVCTLCGIDKPITEYYFRKDNQKFRKECKVCITERSCKWDTDNKEQRSETNKIYRENNKEKIRAQNKIWRDNSGDYRKNYVKNNQHIMKPIRDRIYQKHKEKYSLLKKKWYQNNKERHAATREKYELENKDRLRAARRKWEKERMETDINYLLQKTLRSRVRDAIKKSGGIKSERTEVLIGCNTEFFRVYIENQFKEGMTWGNWSLDGWHLDHKIPLSWFNLENEGCRMLAFNYKNMQPLWAFENAKKSNHYADEVVF